MCVCACVRVYMSVCEWVCVYKATDSQSNLHLCGEIENWSFMTEMRWRSCCTFKFWSNRSESEELWPQIGQFRNMVVCELSLCREETDQLLYLQDGFSDGKRESQANSSFKSCPNLQPGRSRMRREGWNIPCIPLGQGLGGTNERPADSLVPLPLLQ